MRYFAFLGGGGEEYLPYTRYVVPTPTPALSALSGDDLARGSTVSWDRGGFCLLTFCGRLAQ